MRRAVAVLSVVVLTAAGAVAALAATPRRHTVSIQPLLTELGSVPNGTVTLVGITKGRPFGPGVLRVDARPQSSSSYADTIQILTPAGSVRATGANTITAQSDGSSVYAGTMRITGGTGRFRGARSGTLVIEGTQGAGDNIIRMTITGAMRF